MLAGPAGTTHIVAMRKPRRVVVLVVPPIEELDLVGPVQVLSTATRLMGRGGTPYAIEVVSTTHDRLIPGESGLALVARARYTTVVGEIDSLLVVSGVKGRNRRDDELAAWLRRTAPDCRRVGAVCIAAFLLAQAGVRTSQRVTVHWKYAHELAHRYPGLRVDPNPIWVQAGNIYTSSGFSAGIDLALAWVAEDCGSAIAIEAARELVLFLRRPAGQLQLSVTLAAQASEMRPIQAPGLDRRQPGSRSLDVRPGRPRVDERPQLRPPLHRRYRHHAGQVRAPPARRGRAAAVAVVLARSPPHRPGRRLRQRGRNAPGVRGRAGAPAARAARHQRPAALTLIGPIWRHHPDPGGRVSSLSIRVARGVIFRTVAAASMAAVAFPDQRATLTGSAPAVA
jgi:putative intracellular protease/amidase